MELDRGGDRHGDGPADCRLQGRPGSHQLERRRALPERQVRQVSLDTEQAHGPGANPTPEGMPRGLGVLDPRSWLRRSAVVSTRGPEVRAGRHTVVDRVLDLGIYVALIGLIIYFWQASPY